jgi:pimeloyl-ACP methyl ester carboxylesterase
MPLDYARRMEAVLKDVRLHVIDACGHVPQVECPEPFLAALKEAIEASSGQR